MRKASLACFEGVRSRLHLAVVERTGHGVTQIRAVVSTDHESRGGVDEQVEERAISGGNRPSQTRLLWSLGLPLRQMARLIQ